MTEKHRGGTFEVQFAVNEKMGNATCYTDIGFGILDFLKRGPDQ